MFKYLINLEIKEFFRSKRFGKRMAGKIALIFMFLYFTLMMVVGGFGLYYGLKESMPDADVFLVANSYLIYFFGVLFVLLLLMTSSPSLQIKALMILPLKKKGIISYFMVKLIFNLFFLLVVILLFSYSAALMTDGHNIVKVLSWALALLSVTVSLILTGFLMEKSNKAVLVVLLSLLLIFILKKTGLIDIPGLSARLFYIVYQNPLWLFVYLAIFFALLKYTFNILKNGFYLDDIVHGKKEKVKELQLTWLDRFGTLSIFLKNDIRMIWRNKRPRQTFFWSFYFLFYGAYLINKYSDNSLTSLNFNIAIASMFITSGFLFSFGNYVPAWDSEYYRLFMSQNIKYKQYIESKWWLMIVSVLFFSVLSIPFIYFGINILLLILAMAVFNMGFNSYLVIIGGMFNDKPIKLSEKAKRFQNTKGFNGNAFILGMLRLILPLLIFYLSKRIGGVSLGVGVLFAIGVIGIILKSIILDYIVKIYIKKKYALLESFAKEE
jgi:hypothetical protein